MRPSGPISVRGSPRSSDATPSSSASWVRSGRPKPVGSPPTPAAPTARTGSMGSPIPKASPPLSLATQQGHLLRRYPNCRVARSRERLVWMGELTPTEYTATYELLIDHQVG